MQGGLDNLSLHKGTWGLIRAAALSYMDPVLQGVWEGRQGHAVSALFVMADYLSLGTLQQQAGPFFHAPVYNSNTAAKSVAIVIDAVQA